jgi:hypothetical protein
MIAGIHKLHLIWSLLLLSSVVAGCGGQTAVSAKTDEDEAKIGKPLTDKECKQFARAMEDAAWRGDLDAFNAQIDWEVTFNRAMAGLDVPKETREKYLATAREAVKHAGIGAVIIGEISNGGSYQLTRLHEQDGQKRLLFRLMRPDGTVTYHDYVMERNDKGKVKAEDFYLLGSGELMSETQRRFILPTAYPPDAQPANLTAEEITFLNHYSEVKQFNNACSEHDFEQVRKIFDQFPDSLKKDKRILRSLLVEAEKAGEEQRDAALEAYTAAHAGEPSLHLSEIDYYYEHQQYDRALDHIDSLDKTVVGGDPYLSVLRAMMYLGKNDLMAARDMAEKAVTQDSSLISGYWTLLSIALRTRNHPETAKLVAALHRKFNIDFDNLEDDALYAEYVKSPEYQQSLKKKR